LSHDVIALRGEPGGAAEAEPLLHKVMEGGRIVEHQPSLNEARETFFDEFARLAPENKSISDPAPYRVELSPSLRALQEKVEREVVAREL
jgi:hypothetical protein